MFLNVGCGFDRHDCDVCVDIHKDSLADIITDAHFLPFRSGLFDGIYSSHCIEHLDSPFKALCEFYRVLKIGNHIVVSIPNVGKFSRILRYLLGKGVVQDFEHIYCWGRSEIKNMFLKVGFRRIVFSYGTDNYHRDLFLCRFFPRLFYSSVIIEGFKI